MALTDTLLHNCRKPEPASYACLALTEKARFQRQSDNDFLISAVYDAPRLEIQRTGYHTYEVAQTFQS